MNCQVDVIVIGDSKSGNAALKAIASNNPTIKLIFVSREFKSTTTRDFLNVEYIKEEVVFIDYKNRLFGCYLKNGDRLYSTHLIIASGLKYDPLYAGNKQVPNVFHNTDDIPKSAKYQPAVVIGDSNTDIKFALAVAKKYKQVYLCSSSLTFADGTTANMRKLNDAKNIVVLPNTSLLKVINKEGVLTSVELDNYSTITCSAIYAKTYAVADTSFVPDKIITRDEAGHLKTSDIAQSLIVPKCFAVGECAAKSTKKMLQAMIDSVLKDFNGGR